MNPELPARTAARRSLGKLLVWGLVLLLLGWALRDIQFNEIWHTLTTLKRWQVLLLVLVNASIVLLNGARWWLILRTEGSGVPYLPVAGYRLISFGISYFTPGPQFGGEPAQVAYLQRRHQVAVSSALASVSLDKILELLANFAFLLLGFLAALQTGLFADLNPVQALAWMGVPFALLLAYTAAVWKEMSPLASLLARLPLNGAWKERLQRIVAGAEKQISAYCLRSPRAVLSASALSLLIWLVMVLEYWLAAQFLGVRLEPAQTIAALTAARISFLFPLPGGLGVLEASQVLVMQALGFSPTLGISLSLLMRARDISLGGAGLLISMVLARSGPTLTENNTLTNIFLPMEDK